jgi:hypothetical protein
MFTNLWVYARAKDAIRNFPRLPMTYTAPLNVLMKNLENVVLHSNPNDSMPISLNHFFVHTFSINFK